MKRIGAGIVAPVLMVILALSACEATPAPSALPDGSRPAASLGPSASPAASPEPGSPTPGATDGSSPTPATLVLGGRWVKPRSNAKVTSSRTVLAARPSASGPGVTTFSKVVFSAAWGGGTSQTVCEASAPDEDGAWRCSADLLALGVPPGKVTLSFDVYGVDVPVAVAADGPRTVTYAVRPPKPTDTRWKETGFEKSGRFEITHTFKVQWAAPDGYADEFLVYQTFECPRTAKQNAGTPCFVAGTPVDVSALTLLGTAPADARSVKVQLTEDTGGCEIGTFHGTILLRARNRYGDSPFAVVVAEHVIWLGPHDVPC